MLRNLPNRVAWYESLDKEREEDKRIILAEFVIEDIQFFPDSIPVELRKGPIVVYFKLLDLNPIEFRQEFLLESMTQTCDFYRTGKAVILSLTYLPEIPPAMVDLVVEIKREIQECGCVHEFPLAMTKIDLNPLFYDLRQEYVERPCKVPIIKSQKDWYVLTTDETGAVAAGTIDVSIRLSSFDNFAVSHMTIGTQEAVLSPVPRRQKRIYTCQDFEHLDPIQVCCGPGDPFAPCDISIYMLDAIMTAATSGIPDDIDNWIALAQHQGWKPQPKVKPIIEKAEAEAILSKICPDECAGFHPLYPRPRYSKIRGDTTRPPECTEVCPTYKDAYKPFTVCPKKLKKVEEFLKDRKPCPDVCPLCYFEHDPPISPAKIYMSEFAEEEDGEGMFPLPFEYHPFPFEKEEEPLAGDPEECDISCPWWSSEGMKKRQRNYRDGLSYERKKCPEQCPDCFYDEDFEKLSSSSRNSSVSGRTDEKRKSRSKRKEKRKKSASYSSSSSSSSSEPSGSSQSERKSKAKVDCKCVHPDEPPEKKYPCLSSFHPQKYATLKRGEQGDAGRRGGERDSQSQKRSITSNRGSRSQRRKSEDSDTSSRYGDDEARKDSNKQRSSSRRRSSPSSQDEDEYEPGDKSHKKGYKRGSRPSKYDERKRESQPPSDGDEKRRSKKGSQQPSDGDEKRRSKKGSLPPIEEGGEGRGSKKGVKLPNDGGEGQQPKDKVPEGRGSKRGSKEKKGDDERKGSKRGSEPRGAELGQRPSLLLRNSLPGTGFYNLGNLSEDTIDGRQR